MTEKISETFTDDKRQLLRPVTDAPTDDDSMDYWVAWIGDAWRKSIESIFETGDRLIAFRKKFEHGEWQKAIHDNLRMSRQTVSRLIAIAENTVLRENVTHVYHLPASWGTLYEIVQLPDEIVRKKIASGEINSSTQRKDVVRMRNDLKQMKQKEDSIERLEGGRCNDERLPEPRARRPTDRAPARRGRPSDQGVHRAVAGFPRQHQRNQSAKCRGRDFGHERQE